ncbi:MAG: SpoIIE family protein phosphatase, partial [Bacteroidia bacterium]
MGNILHKLGNTGIDQNTPFGLRNKLRVYNNANVTIFFITVFYVVIGLVQHYYVAVGVTFYSLMSSVVALLLVKQGKYKLAFHYTFVYGFTFLSAFTWLFGGASNTYLYFLFIPVACNILFDKRWLTVFYAVLGAVFMIANSYYIQNYKPYYDLEAWMMYFSYPNIVFVSMLIFFGVSLFKGENQLYAKKIDEQKKVLEEKNKEITDSINYAKRIQQAKLPKRENIFASLPQSFILFKPKDIVSGDFYFFHKKNNGVFIAAADCTGHGVPGAFMSMIGSERLEDAVSQSENVSEILNQLNRGVKTSLQQSANDESTRDGMDIALCSLNIETGILKYAGANRPLWIIRKEATEIEEIKATKQAIGGLTEDGQKFD